MISVDRLIGLPSGVKKSQRAKYQPVNAACLFTRFFVIRFFFVWTVILFGLFIE
jgi:hypothetical protein